MHTVKQITIEIGEPQPSGNGHFAHPVDLITVTHKDGSIEKIGTNFDDIFLLEKKHGTSAASDAAWRFLKSVFKVQ